MSAQKYHKSTKMSDSYLGDSTAVILATTAGKLLLQHRDDIKGIEYPDYLCLIGGWIEEGETPDAAIKREIHEEIVTNDGKYLNISSVHPVYSCKRNDRPWTEHVFYAVIYNDVNTIEITEGQSIQTMRLDKCLAMEKFAPHHIMHLEKFKAKFNLLEVLKMTRVNDYIEQIVLGDIKDYKALEAGDGYILPSGEFPVGVIHTKEDAKIIALLVFAKNVPRGNHYHHKKVEYMTVLKGTLHCQFYLPSSPEDIFEVVLTPGQQVKILPGCVHIYTALEDDVYAIEYAPQRYEENDVVVLE